MLRDYVLVPNRVGDWHVDIKEGGRWNQHQKTALDSTFQLKVENEVCLHQAMKGVKVNR